MPGKNSVKEYIENGVYHVYNRGLNKQDIFLDDQDYSTFLYYLMLYLNDPSGLRDLDPQKRKYLSRKNFFGLIELMCYCLMPNHFHLIIRQKEERNISDFLRCVITNYSMYFNDKYSRVGPLFQGRYKAILVKNDDYLLHLSRYIHLNPAELAKGQTLGRRLEEYDFSSYASFLGKKNISWLKPKFILEYFGSKESISASRFASYKEFVEKCKVNEEELLGKLILE